jgi:ligand-binding sensor domain-containing protein
MLRIGSPFNSKVCIAVILIWLVPLLVFSQFEGKEFIHYSTKDGLTDNSISALAQDRFGYMWIGTEQGLGRFDGLNVNQYHSESHKESLPSEEILNLKWR